MNSTGTDSTIDRTCVSISSNDTNGEDRHVLLYNSSRAYLLWWVWVSQYNLCSSPHVCLDTGIRIYSPVSSHIPRGKIPLFQRVSKEGYNRKTGEGNEKRWDEEGQGVKIDGKEEEWGKQRQWKNQEQGREKKKERRHRRSLKWLNVERSGELIYLEGAYLGIRI